MGACPVLWLEDSPALAVAEAVRILKRHGVVLFPTDTVYGLLALATSAQAYAGIYSIKGRAASDPLQLLAQRTSPLAHQALSLLGEQSELRERLLAGKVTLVADSLPGVPQAVSSIQSGSVGLRLPVSAPLDALLEAVGPPHLVWATSANASGQPACATAQQAQSWLAGVPDKPQLAVLAQPPCPGSPSSVVRFAGGKLLVLR